MNIFYEGKNVINFIIHSSSEDSTSDEDESHPQMNDSQLFASKDNSELMTFELLFPSMKEVYGMQPEYPARNDIILYKR